MTLLLLALTSGNFVGPDAALVSAAEAARVRSARFWTGRPLPGDWAAACPIRISSSTGGAGGVTRFRFAGGHVGGWSMRLSGRPEAVLADGLPHEVDHMVRATLVRRPVPRWLDEGCASLMESPDEHARLRREAGRFAASGRPVTFFGQDTYPADARRVRELYAVGFALAEHLVRRLGPDAVLDVQRHASPEAALTDRGWPPRRIVRDWRDSLEATASDCVSAGCPVHAHEAARCGPAPVASPAPPPRPVLTVHTAAWCGACRRFEQDRRTDATFAAALERRVVVRPLPPGHAATLPTFELNGRTLVGYAGKAWLIERIDRELRRASDPQRPSHDAGETGKTSARSLGVSPEAKSASPGQTSGVDIERSQPTPPRATQGADAPRSPGDGDDPPAVTCFEPPSRWARAVQIGGVTLTALEAAGLGVGAAATGGLGIALLALTRLRRRRAADLRPDVDPHPPPPPRAAPDHAARDAPTDADLVPLPRELDEARELLSLRQREGRVGALDALRGMVLDDELERLTHSPDARPGDADAARRLKSLVDDRVAAIAPLSVRRE